MTTPTTPAAPRNTEEQLVRQALGHLRGLVDILGPCDHFDHHGYCQTHFIESPCRVGKAREFLESLPNSAICLTGTPPRGETPLTRRAKSD